MLLDNTPPFLPEYLRYNQHSLSLSLIPLERELDSQCWVLTGCVMVKLMFWALSKISNVYIYIIMRETDKRRECGYLSFISIHLSYRQHLQYIWPQILCNNIEFGSPHVVATSKSTCFSFPRFLPFYHTTHGPFQPCPSVPLGQAYTPAIGV
jgi:hypothetical protein